MLAICLLTGCKSNKMQHNDQTFFLFCCHCGGNAAVKYHGCGSLCLYIFCPLQKKVGKVARFSKKCRTFALALKKSIRDVAQLVAHYVRDVGVGRSSRLIPTKISENRHKQAVFFDWSPVEGRTKLGRNRFIFDS